MSTRTFAYIGAGTHMTPIRVFDAICRRESTMRSGVFVFVDSRPCTEFPSVENREEQSSTVRSDYFVQEVERKASNLGFQLDVESSDRYSVNPFMRRFVREDGSVLKYYFSTFFPEDIERRQNSPCISSNLVHDLSLSSTLIFSGFDPHRSILDLMSKESPVRIWAFENTCFARCEVEPDKRSTSLLEALHEPSFIDRVDSIEFIRKCYDTHHVRSIAELARPTW